MGRGSGFSSLGCTTKPPQKKPRQSLVGAGVGEIVGAFVANLNGIRDGAVDGTDVDGVSSAKPKAQKNPLQLGLSVGMLVGGADGTSDGSSDGIRLGESLGSWTGRRETSGLVGPETGAGETVGASVTKAPNEHKKPKQGVFPGDASSSDEGFSCSTSPSVGDVDVLGDGVDRVGDELGMSDETTVGTKLGDSEGKFAVYRELGVIVENSDGDKVGLPVGYAVGAGVDDSSVPNGGVSNTPDASPQRDSSKPIEIITVSGLFSSPSFRSQASSINDWFSPRKRG